MLHWLLRRSCLGCRRTRARFQIDEPALTLDDSGFQILSFFQIRVLFSIATKAHKSPLLLALLHFRGRLTFTYNWIIRWFGSQGDLKFLEIQIKNSWELLFNETMKLRKLLNRVVFEGKIC